MKLQGSSVGNQADNRDCMRNSSLDNKTAIISTLRCTVTEQDGRNQSPRLVMKKTHFISATVRLLGSWTDGSAGPLC